MSFDGIHLRQNMLHEFKHDLLAPEESSRNFFVYGKLLTTNGVGCDSFNDFKC